MAAYNPGVATEPVKGGEGRYCIDSFRGEGKTYEVTLTPTGCRCTCPHYTTRLAGTDGQCKHILACLKLEASQPQPTKLEKALETAETLSDTDLKRFAALKRGTAAGAACLLELAARQVAAQAATQPKPIPAGVMDLLAGATDAEKARALEIYR